MAERLKLSNQMITKIAEAVRSGAPFEASATAAGVAPSQLTAWIKRGNELRDYSLKFGCYQEGTNREDWACAKMVDEMEQAHAEVIVRYSKAINTAVKKGAWSAAAWWLDRRAKDHYTTQAKPQVEAASRPQVTVYVPDNGRGPKAAT